MELKINLRAFKMVFEYYSKFCKRCGTIYKTKGRYSRFCKDCIKQPIPKNKGVRPEQYDWKKIKKKLFPT